MLQRGEAAVGQVVRTPRTFDSSSSLSPITVSAMAGSVEATSAIVVPIVTRRPNQCASVDVDGKLAVVTLSRVAEEWCRGSRFCHRSFISHGRLARVMWALSCQGPTGCAVRQCDKRDGHRGPPPRHSNTSSWRDVSGSVCNVRL